MKNFLKTVAVAVAIGAMLAGCASLPPPPDADRSHPANPAAAASSVPPLETGLLKPAGVTATPAADSRHEHHE